MATSRPMSGSSRGGPPAGAGVETDPTALTLLRSAELTRQRQQSRLLADVAALRRQTAALREQRAALQAQLDASQPDSRRMDDSFAMLGRQTVWRHLGVWAAASAPVSGGGRRTAVRLKLDDDQPAYTLQLQHGGQRDAPVTATVRDLPPGVRLDTHLEQHGTRRQVPELVHAVASEVDAFSSRRRQVADLRAALPARHSHVWHDPTVCEVSLQMQLNVGGDRSASSRLAAELNMRYSPGAALPYQCRVIETQTMDKEDREELKQLSSVFLRLPLREAFREAFQ